MELSFTITPSISPMDRGVIEDALGEGVEFLGGGTWMGPGPGQSDFSLEVPPGDAEAVAARCREAVACFSFSQPTRIALSIGEASFELPVRFEGEQPTG